MEIFAITSRWQRFRMRMLGYKFDKKNIPVERGPSKDHHLRYKGKTYVYGPETGLLRCAYENVSTETEEFFLKALDPLRAETSVEPYQALQEIAKEYYELMEASEKLTGNYIKDTPWKIPAVDRDKAVQWWNVLGNEFYHLPIFKIGSLVDSDLTPELHKAVNADVIMNYSFGLLYDIVINEVRIKKHIRRGTVKQEVSEKGRPETTDGTGSPSPIYDLNIKWGPEPASAKKVRDMAEESFINLPKGIHRLNMAFNNTIRLWAYMPDKGSGVMASKELRSLDKEQYLNERYWLVRINGVNLKFWKDKSHYVANTRFLEAEDLNKVLR